MKTIHKFLSSTQLNFSCLFLCCKILQNLLRVFEVSLQGVNLVSDSLKFTLLLLEIFIRDIKQFH